MRVVCALAILLSGCSVALAPRETPTAELALERRLRPIRPSPAIEWRRSPDRECIIEAKMPDVIGYRVGGLVRSVWSTGGVIRVYSPCDCPTSYDLIVLEYADGDEISVPIINVPPCDGD